MEPTLFSFINICSAPIFVDFVVEQMQKTKCLIMQETFTCSVKAISLSTNLHIIELVCFTKFTKNGAHKNY